MSKALPLKRFGQNYLQDENILRKIASEIAPLKNEIIIEIGPGYGALTKYLLSSQAEIIAVEIDKRVIEYLLDKFPNLNLIEKDFLKLDLSKMVTETQTKVRIAGNIPYNITSPILFKLFEYNKYIKDAVILVQYEVGKRMTAKPGTKDYGILSVLLNYYGKAQLIFRVSPNVFYPRPNVYSSLMHITFNNERNNYSYNKVFQSIVKSSFGNRRKTLKNSLSNSIFAGINFNGSGIDLNLRAEQLSLDEFFRLTDIAIKQKALS